MNEVDNNNDPKLDYAEITADVPPENSSDVSVDNVTEVNICNENVLNLKDCINNDEKTTDIIENSQSSDKNVEIVENNFDQKMDEEQLSNSSQTNSNVNVTINRPPYIPPHLMGRDLNNPAQDMVGSGRRVQKPRLGVKVPYRNLTSQIVSQDEIAQEILERSLRKYSYSDVPEGGDVFFAMKLTHRLANKISSSNSDLAEKLNETNILKNERCEIQDIKNKFKKKDILTSINKVNNIEQHSNIEIKTEFKSTNLDSPTKTAVPSASSELQLNTTTVSVKSPSNITSNLESPSNIITECTNSVSSSRVETESTNLMLTSEIEESEVIIPESVSSLDPKDDKLLAEISSKLNEENNKTLTELNPLIPNTDSNNKNYNVAVNGSVSQVGETELDNDTLLAILEGTSDLNDTNSNSTSTPLQVNISGRGKKRVKYLLDPNIEKELALKQLMDFEIKKNHEKHKKSAKKIKLTNQKSAGSLNSNDKSNNAVQNQTKGEARNHEISPVKPKRNSRNFSSAPRRLPKKYHRIIKKQLRSSKRKNKNISSEQQKKLPEVPEVKIAIDRFIKTYANKRKYKPDSKLQKPEEKVPVEDKTKKFSVQDNMKHQEVQVETISDENYNETNETNMDIAKSSETTLGSKQKASSKVMREINRLLGDEGAINMIYSIEQKRLPDNKRDANVLPSLRRKKKDLLLKTKLVKNAVLRLSMSSSQVMPSRVRRSPETTNVTKSCKSSPETTAVIITPSNTPEQLPKFKKVAAEASKIIRRHSSSSSYSSDEEINEKSNLEPKKFNIRSQTENNLVSVTSEQKTSTKSTSSSELQSNEVRNLTTLIESNNNECQTKEKYISKDWNLLVKSTKKNSDHCDNNVNVNLEKEKSNNHLDVSNKMSFKEITVKKYDNLVQIILISSSTKMKNALNIEVLRELSDILLELGNDDTCRTVLITSTGSSFCQGIDLETLICPDKTQRIKIVQDFISALVTFIERLSQFPKLLIAGVHGSAVGLGVTMLPFFDMVYASDKATFYMPYVKLGQIPEAASALTLPHLLGNAITSELLYASRMLTATEALQFGLVTRTLWPDKFSEELIPLAKGISSYSSQSMVSTKFLLRQEVNSKLQKQLQTEAELLREHWCSDECQTRFKEFLQQEALLQNK